jgi:hypothetical protein
MKMKKIKLNKIVMIYEKDMAWMKAMKKMEWK